MPPNTVTGRQFHKQSVFFLSSKAYFMENLGKDSVAVTLLTTALDYE